MLSRRETLLGIVSGAGLALAIPAVVKATSLMPISSKKLIVPRPGPVLLNWRAFDTFGNVVASGRTVVPVDKQGYHSFKAIDEGLNWLRELAPNARWALQSIEPDPFPTLMPLSWSEYEPGRYAFQAH